MAEQQIITRGIMESIRDGRIDEKVDRKGNTLLHLVHKLTHTRLLIEAGWDVNAKNKRGQTPLCFEKNPQAIKLLIDSGARVNHRDSSEDTPLHYIENPVSVRYLLEAGARVDARNENYETPLHLKRHPDSIKLLIDAGANVNAFNLRGSYGATPLYYKIEDHNIEGVRILLDAGAKVNGVRDILGDTPLHIAKNRTIIVLLLKKGADPNIPNQDYETPLDGPYGTFIENALKEIEKRKAQQAQQQKKRKQEQKKQSDQLIREFAQNIQQIHNKDQDGNTYLHVYTKFPSVVEFLLQHGANPFMKNKNGKIPLQMARLNQESKNLLSNAMSEMIVQKKNRLLHLLQQKPDLKRKFQQQILNKDLICPISTQLITYPVRNAIHSLYDKQCIEKWEKQRRPLRQNVKDPSTNLDYFPIPLVSDTTKFYQINQLLDRHLQQLQRQQGVQQTKAST